MTAVWERRIIGTRGLHRRYRYLQYLEPQRQPHDRALLRDHEHQLADLALLYELPQHTLVEIERMECILLGFVAFPEANQVRR